MEDRKIQERFSQDSVFLEIPQENLPCCLNAKIKKRKSFIKI